MGLQPTKHAIIEGRATVVGLARPFRVEGREAVVLDMRAHATAFSEVEATIVSRSHASTSSSW